MNRQRFAALLVAAFVALSGAVFLSSRRNPPRQTENAPLLPALAGEMNSITAVMIRKGGPAPTSTIHKVGQEWTVAERADYPADVAMLRKLLLALREAKIVEEKTSDPQRYAEIGVADPSSAGDAGGAGAQITVASGAGKEAVIVGKPVGTGSFVRRAGEKRSYSVEPAINFETEPRFWIDPRLIDVAAALIQGIDVKPATGPAYALHRSKAAGDTFTLDAAPTGRKPLDPPALAPAPTLLAGLTADDVSPAAAVDFSHSSQAVVTLSDGNAITLTGAVVADKHWVQIKSSKDTALTAKAQGRAFEVAGYRYDAIFKPLEQLLVPKQTPATKAPRTAVPAPRS